MSTTATTGSIPIPHNELSDKPGTMRWIQDINKSLVQGAFTPTTSDIGTVTSSQCIFQRVGSLLFFHMEFLGNLSVDPASDYIELPFQTRASNYDTTATAHLSSMIVFATSAGVYLNHGHVVAGTNRIIPEATVSNATGISVQGYYWVNT